MSAMALPKVFKVTRTNKALCDRLGVKINGRDLGRTVFSYDVANGVVRLVNGDVITGQVEPYWRDNK